MGLKARFMAPIPPTPEWLLLDDELLLVEMIECGRLFPCLEWSIEHTAMELRVLAANKITLLYINSLAKMIVQILQK